MSNPEGTLKRRWRLLLLEIIAIFLGITASFWVEEWREERQDTAAFHRILCEEMKGQLLEAWRRYAEQNEVFDHAGHFDAIYRRAYGLDN